jgi:hypothetical protein
VSAWEPRTERRVIQPKLTEREAVRLLTGVGGESEWWLFSVARVGQLRVPVTGEESAQIPPGCVVGDAGETGPQRPRTRR